MVDVLLGHAPVLVPHRQRVAGLHPRSHGLLGLWCVLRQAAGHADPWGGEWTAWATGVLVLIAIETRRTASRAPAFLLYGGAVSYSLYLVHLPVIDTVLGAMFKVTGDDTAWAFVSLAVGAVACFVAAHVLLVLVERPANGSRRGTSGTRASALTLGRERVAEVPDRMVPRWGGTQTISIGKVEQRRGQRRVGCPREGGLG